MPPRNLDRAKGFQVVSDKLRVEQRKAAGAQPRDEMHERDFGSVALEMEHAFAEKRAPEPHAVEAADEFFAIVNFNRVAMADLVQARV